MDNAQAHDPVLGDAVTEGAAAVSTARNGVAGSNNATSGAKRERRIVTELPGPNSRALTARRDGAVTTAVSSAFPIYVSDAAGALVRDVDGNSFIDLGAGIAVMTVGHGAELVTEAVREQAGRFTHTCFTVAPYEPYVAVCEQLNELTPGTHPKRSALFNSGAEAVENAVKIARHATGRQAVVVFDHAYHGRTNLTMAMTAKNVPYKDRFGPFAPEVYRVPTSYPFRDPEGMTGEDAAARSIGLIESQVGADRVACVLIEPIHGEGGFVVPAPGFLSSLAAWCRDRGVLFVADEVQTGFARTGSWFACEHEQIVPDLIVTGKGIAGGLPLSGVTGREEVMNRIHPGGLGGTFAGNPVAAAAALGAIATMRELDLPAVAQRLGSVIASRFAEMARTSPSVGDVRGRGAMAALEFVRPGTKEPDAAAAREVAQHAFHEGVIVLTCGTYGNVIRLIPPLVISEALLGEALDVLADGVARLTR